MSNGKITLKKVKVFEGMSEETPCFTADVYQDGKLIAHAKNSGHGGCNDISPANGVMAKDVAFLWNVDIDCDIMTMVETDNFVKKNQSKKFVLKKDDNFYTVKALTTGASFASIKKHSNYKNYIDKRVNEYKAEGYEVLNTNF